VSGLDGDVPCVIPGLTVFDANSLTAKITPALTLLASPSFAVNQYAVPQDPACASPALYAPGTTPFASSPRQRSTAATSSEHVRCWRHCRHHHHRQQHQRHGRSGTPADTLVADLPTAFSNGATQSNGEPPNQNPILLLTGSRDRKPTPAIGKGLSEAVWNGSNFWRLLLPLGPLGPRSASRRIHRGSR